MDVTELLDNISVILENESRMWLKHSRNSSDFRTRKYYIKFSDRHGEGFREIPKDTEEVLNDSFNIVKSEFENLTLLLTLYNKIKNDDYPKREFINALINDLKNGSHTRAYLPFEALIKLGRLDDALNTLKEIGNPSTISFCLQDLNELLKFETKRFSLEDLKKIEEILSSGIANIRGDCASLGHKIKEQINEINHRRLKKELKEINSFEIDRDQEEVKVKLKEQNFSERIVEAINNLNRKYDDAKTEVDFNGVVDSSRKILDALQREIASKIIEKTGSQIKGKIENASEVRDYLKQQGLLTKKEFDLLKGLYGFLSDEGTHNFKSNIVYARLGKNMLIEVSLLLLTNSEEYFK